MDNVRLAAPGVVDGTIQLEVFNAVTEFLQFTKAWTEDVNFTTAVGVTDYEITPDASATVDSLVAVVNADGKPVGATMSDLGTVELNIEPTASEVLTAIVALSVDNPADREGNPVYPAAVLKKYMGTLIAGVTYRLQLQPTKSYSNQQLGILNMRKFRGGCATARAEIKHQNLYGGQRWRFPGFATGQQR